MTYHLAKSALALAVAGVLSACKLTVEVDSGGSVASASGTNDCPAGTTCEITITALDFSDTFTAVPAAGYTFSHWEDSGGYFCGGSTHPVCAVSNTALAGIPEAEAAVQTDLTFYISPVFDAIDSDGDGDPDVTDPDDDNDGVPDEDDPAPLDPDIPASGPCGSVPAGVNITDPVNWGNPGGQVRIDLNQTEIKATPFTTTSGASYAGQISVASTTGNSGVQRRVWISECPGGDALSDPKCEDYGTSSTVVQFYQGPSHPSYCNLSTNTDYYINMQNQNCPDAECDVYRIIYNNGNP